MALIRPTTVTTARRTSQPGREAVRYEHVAQAARPRSVPTSFTPAQMEMLEYVYDEKTAPEPGVVTIPATVSVGAPTRMYADARVLELGGLVTLNTPGNERVSEAPPVKMPWLYTWTVELTPKGARTHQERIAAAIARTLPRRTLREMATRPVPDPSVGADAPVSTGVTRPRAPRPGTTSVPVPEVESPEFVCT